VPERVRCSASFDKVQIGALNDPAYNDLVQSLTNVVYAIEPSLNQIYYLAFGSVEGRDLP
jgi:hypothetical protein